MLAGTGSKINKSAPPPPLPPKPKSNVVIINSNDSKQGSNRSNSSIPNTNHTREAAISSDGDFNLKYTINVRDCHEPVILDDNDHDYYLDLDPKTSTQLKYSQEPNKAPTNRYARNLPKNQPTSNDYLTSHSTSNLQASRPIVTESPEEANNNNIVKHDRTKNTSTVEILEVPYKHSSNNFYGRSNNTTFNRSALQQQLYYENNSYATPVVTTATDEEDGDQSDNDVALPMEMEVESILNESSNAHPPRTSTPNQIQGSNSSEDTSTATNDNKPTHKLHVSVVNMHDSSVNQSDEDTVNISRDTDELTNTSALNQSGGGEIIGVNDNSDSANVSKDSPRNLNSHAKLPFTVQDFDENTMFPPSSPNQNVDKCQKESPHSHCREMIRGLENFTNSLQNEVDFLKTQIVSLTSKFAELEGQFDKQCTSFKQTMSRNRSNLTSRQNDNLSPTNQTNTMSKHGFSQSTSTINKISSPSTQHATGQNLTSTYSRNNVATISRNPNTSLNYPTNGPSSMNNRFGLSQSCNNTVNKSLKKSSIHASTNSLYAESQKSGSASISPTPNYQQYLQSISPASSMMTLTNKRDPMSCTSMLSLSSLTHPGGSTLKKASMASGSVTNLSQVGSQLAVWPSMTEFVPAKHRGKEIFYNEDERTIHMTLYNRLINMRLPNWIEDNYNLEKVVEPPTVRLKLDWVHGYRGRDCRCNIFYLPTGECVYFVASIVVLYNPDDKRQRHYLGHTDSVKCLAVHPNKLIIASGQSIVQNRPDRRPIVRVWNTVSLATLRVIGFNEDFDRSICCLAFSKHDQGATLAVVDESPEHTITLLDWQREKNWRLAETNSGHEAVLAIDFHPIDKYSLVAVGKSSINFWDIRGMTLTKKTGLFDKYDKPKYVLCLTFNNFGDTVTGDSNGNLIIWPRGSNRPRKVIHDVHQGGVFSVLAMKDGSYLTGGRDRRVIEWDENFNRTGREAELPEHCGGIRYITYARGSQVLIGTLRNSILLGSLENNFIIIMQGHAEATSSLAVHPNNNHYLTGGFDDQIHLFDTITHDTVWSKCLMMPATASSFSPNGSLLVVGSTLGKWLVIDAVTQEILFTKCDGSGLINCIKFSPDGEYFAMGSSDGQVYIYQTSEAGSKFYRIGTCVGHSTPVKEIDWSDDSLYLQTQSLNFELLFWKALNCRPLDDLDVIDDLKWYTHNCTLSFSTIGLWSDSIDSALINYCDKSNNNDLMVSVTDIGNINIFRWPPCYNQCLSQKYYGNVEKFNFIKFLPDDSRLIAVGAKNCVTTEWIVDKGDCYDL